MCLFLWNSEVVSPYYRWGKLWYLKWVLQNHTWTLWQCRELNPCPQNPTLNTRSSFLSGSCCSTFRKINLVHLWILNMVEKPVVQEADTIARSYSHSVWERPAGVVIAILGWNRSPRKSAEIIWKELGGSLQLKY